MATATKATHTSLNSAASKKALLMHRRSLHPRKVAATLALFGAVGCTSTTASTHDTSIEEHRASAEREQGEALGARGTPDPSYPGETAAPYSDRVTGREDFAAETSSGIRVLRYGEHSKHAKQHEQSARLLETFEEAECARSPGQERAACPILVAVSRVENIRAGVRMYLVPGVDTQQVLNHMRCHHAFGRVHGFEEMDACPLYLQQLQIREVEPGVIELTGRGINRVEEIQRRSREHVVQPPREPVEESP